MEDNVQTIIITIVAIIVFFIFPTYVAYEKKDDLSYALSLKYTQDFVDNVRAKGYVSKSMYQSYINNLSNTGNTYKVILEHKRKIAIPVTNFYKKINGQNVLSYFINQESKGNVKLKNNDGTDIYSLVENTYRNDEEILSGTQITSILENEDFYEMNVGDEFTALLKNTNTTLATIIYNLVTIGKSDTNTRIYVNYGGTITNETWINAKQYVEYPPAAIPIGTIENILTDIDTTFASGHTNYFGSKLSYTKDFIIEFKAYPKSVTELPAEGVNAAVPNSIDNPRMYNYIIQDYPGSSTSSVGIGITLGINGLAIVAKTNNYYRSILTYNAPITKYTDFKIIVRNNKPVLFIDGQKAEEGIDLQEINGVINSGANLFVKSIVGIGYRVNQQYVGRAMNFKFYNIVAN